MATHAEDIFNPPVTSVMRRFAPLLVVGVLAFGALGYYAGTARAEGFEATASLVLQDLRAQTLFEPVFTDIANMDPERYANNQLAILDSAPVARRAAQMMGREDSDETTQDMLDRTGLAIDAASDVISITFIAEEASTAVGGANAMLQAYLETVEAQAVIAFRAALSQLDAAIATAAEDVDELQLEMSASQSAARPELDQQFDRLVAELVRLSDRLSRATPDSRPALRAELDDIIQQMNGLQAVRTIEEQGSESVALRERLNEAVLRESALLARRNQVVADAEIPRSDLAIASPAVIAVSSRTGLLISTAAGVILGLVAAGAVAYWLSQRRKRFEDERQVGPLVDAPLLAVVPAWRPRSLVPLVENTSSPASGALRALVWTVRRRLSEVSSAVRGDGKESAATGTLLLTTSAVRDGGDESAATGSLLLVTSTDRGSAGAVVAVNLALASTEAGLGALLIDVDDTEQRVSTVLRELGGEVLDAGLRDALRNEVEPDEAVSTVAVGGSPPISFMAAGTITTPNEPVAGVEAVEGFVKWAESRHELVILHVPRLPEQLHLGALISRVPHSLLVVRHRGAVDDTLHVVDRLGGIGVPPIGYVYVHASRRL